MNVRSFLFLNAFVLAGCAATPDADRSLKPGLWSIHAVTDISQSVGSKRTDVTMQRCQDGMTPEQIPNAPAVKDCKISKRQSAAWTTVADGGCTVNGTHMKMNLRSVMSSENEVHSVIETTVEPPMGDIHATKTAADLKFIGACPKDMRPGDVRMPDGKVVHQPRQ